MLRLAPGQVHQARGMVARGGAADRVNQRIFLLQLVAARGCQLRAMRLGQPLRLRLQRGRTHVLGRGVDEVAHQAHGPRFGNGGIDPARLARQQDARPARLLLLLIAVKAVLPRLPAMQRRTRLSASAAGKCPPAAPPPAWPCTSSTAHPGSPPRQPRTSRRRPAQWRSGTPYPRTAALRAPHAARRIACFAHSAKLSLLTRWMGMASCPRSGWMSGSVAVIRVFRLSGVRSCGSCC